MKKHFGKNTKILVTLFIVFVLFCLFLWGIYHSFTTNESADTYFREGMYLRGLFASKVFNIIGAILCLVIIVGVTALFRKMNLKKNDNVSVVIKSKPPPPPPQSATAPRIPATVPRMPATTPRTPATAPRTPATAPRTQAPRTPATPQQTPSTRQSSTGTASTNNSYSVRNVSSPNSSDFSRTPSASSRRQSSVSSYEKNKENIYDDTRIKPKSRSNNKTMKSTQYNFPKNSLKKLPR